MGRVDWLKRHDRRRVARGAWLRRHDWLMRGVYGSSPPPPRGRVAPAGDIHERRGSLGFSRASFESKAGRCRSIYGVSRRYQTQRGLLEDLRGSWRILEALTTPFSPVHNARKFSAALGASSIYSANSILPTA
eukprot:1180711-Prorocentrum_minimum.AAC.2